jgi:hypothetical protein
MWPTYLLYIFVAFIAKAILGVAVCYLILPTERSCDACDEETLPIRMGAVGRLLARASGGRIQRRWCPRCGSEGMTRTGVPMDTPVAGGRTARARLS